MNRTNSEALRGKGPLPPTPTVQSVEEELCTRM
jgi:hypothetical protein